MRDAILSGREIEKPGFTRLNLSYLASDEDVAFILRSVSELSQHASVWAQAYRADIETATFEPAA